MRKNKLFIIFIFLFLKFYSQEALVLEPALMPKPKEIKIQEGQFILSSSTKIVSLLVSPKSANTYLKNEAEYFSEYLKRLYNINIEIINSVPKDGNYIIFEEFNPELISNEGYCLTIDPKRILIKTEKNGAGAFYALQTLIQLLPVANNNSLSITCLDIKDEPRFKWRGMHLDVCRHFFPISFVKKYIDILAMYKMNTFHWHLTDDQGWRIEIKKYPKLTEVGSKRKGTMVGKYSDHKYDSVPYGGFYTQEQIKEVVTYAAKRHITIVPEIEMPGHAVAAIASYPWLSCQGKQIEVEKGWGVFEDVFCTKDSVFNFLQDVLDEVMPLFPGNYVHIGGDESPKTRWKACNNCQSRTKDEKLKDEHELQSYFIKRIEKYINSKGKQIIGWDEILEGGLAPNAAVMSWQGIEGGLAAAKQKHFAVMTPGSHCYFDHYQALSPNEPLSIGGYTPIEKVYNYEPIPDGLTNDEQKFILGAQANLWTEYILSEKHLEYMALPRMVALAEVLWLPKDLKNETDFLNRLQKHFLLLDKLDINYSKSLYKIEQKVNVNKQLNTIEVELLANPSLGEIHYTLDGTEPYESSSVYKSPISLIYDATVKAVLYKDGVLKGNVSVKNYNVNKATNKSVQLKNAPSKSYSGDGAFTLVNGIVATLPRISNQWLGWNGSNLEAIVDLKNSDNISNIQVGFLNEELSWIYLPKSVEYFISNDGLKFTSIGKANFKDERVAVLNFKSVKARYVKVLATNYGKIPSGKPGAGEPSWLFCDEIQIK